jgi:hypothetical protein
MRCILSRLLCFFGVHEWRSRSLRAVYATAVCVRCGLVMDTEVNKCWRRERRDNGLRHRLGLLGPSRSERAS